jgi:hypothetical protein
LTAVVAAVVLAAQQPLTRLRQEAWAADAEAVVVDRAQTPPR